MGFHFPIYALIFIYFFKYETIENHARAFLSLIISATGSVQEDSEFGFLIDSASPKFIEEILSS